MLERALAPGTGGIVTADLRTALAGPRPASCPPWWPAWAAARSRGSRCATLLARAAAGDLEPFSFLDLDAGIVDRELARMRETRRSGPSAENILRDLGVTASRIG